MGKWITDSDTGERYYLPDDKEAKKNVPGYLSDEVK